MRAGRRHLGVARRAFELPSSVTPSTLVNYRNIVKTYLLPHIGTVRVDKLTPVHVRQLLSKLGDAGLSPNTRRLARSVLRRALRTAEADGLVTRNVAALVDGVRVPKPEGRTLRSTRRGTSRRRWSMTACSRRCSASGRLSCC